MFSIFIVFTGAGIATVVFLFLRFSRFVYLYLRPSSLYQYHYGEGPWALVTGASDGIGKCLATELARHSFNVILHGRNPSKLENVVSTLRHQFPQRQFRTAVLDASSATHRQISDLVSSFDDIHLTVLVNNVAGGQIVQPLTNTSPDQVDFSLNCNARFPAQLTRSLLPRFAGSKDRSLILNIGSAANTFAPYASVYGGSKACNQAMSICLNVEMVAENLAPKIEILCISVAAVTEAAQNKAPVSLFTPAASTMAKAILARVGCGRAVVVGYFWHAVQLAVLGLMPMSVTTSIVAPIMRERWEDEKRKE
ncbi:MAG: hypothetical protein L6R36_003510 [Xanthoria steineri]|nr:MAG: hypothetical protein L6R36_003510 [Xanthoria steineri]